MKSESHTLRDYFRVLWRRKWIVLIVALLAPATAIVVSMRQAEVYEASAEVLLRSGNLAGALTGIDSSSGDPARYAKTQARLAGTPAVAERALADIGLTGIAADDVLDSTTISASPDEDLLTVTVRSNDPGLAKQLASGYARAYAAYRQELDTAAIRNAYQGIEQRIAQLESAGQKDSALYQSLVAQAGLLSTAETLQAQNAYVIPADEARKVEPQPVRNGLLGAALGIVLGIGLVFLWEGFDTRIRSAEEIHRRLDLPMLARLAEPPRRARNKMRLVSLGDPSGAAAEAFRVLRTSLEFVLLESNARTIMVTSAVASEGKSTTAANLAVTLARTGRRIALVDLDLRRPSLHLFFDGEQVPGVTDVALGHVGLDDAVIRIALAGEPLNDTSRTNGKCGPSVEGALEILPSGLVPPDPGEFITTPALGRVLDELRARAEIVLIDAPPLLEVGDALALSARIDGLLLVTRLNTLRRPMLQELHRVLDTCPAAKLGFVLAGSEAEEGEGGSGDHDYLVRDLERAR